MVDAGARLQRSLGMGQITASGVGIIIGAGIYVLLAAATAEAAAGVWIAFLLAGALSALTALSYAELAGMFPNAGAEYDYTRRVAPPIVAFLVGWVMISGLVVAAAAVALGFASYVERLIDLPDRLAALGLVGVVTLIALAGIERSVRVTVLLALLQVGGLVLVIAVGVPHLGDHSLTTGITAAGTISAAALVFFAFIGFDEVITLAEETRDPARTVPRGLLLALGLSTLLYVLVAIAGVSVLGATTLGASRQPLADVLATAMGGAAGDLVTVIALAATTNTTLLALTAASRLQYGMATTGALPSLLARLSGRRVPWVAVLGGSSVAAAFVLLGDLTLVASVTDFSVYLVFIAVNMTVILLRFWQPKRQRPFRVPWAVRGVPLPALAALAATVALLPNLAWEAIGLGSALCIAGLLVYAGVLRQRPVRPGAVAPRAHMAARRHISEADARGVADLLRLDFSALDFDLEQFRLGMEVELEHGRMDPDTNVTNDDLLATGKLALAHLQQIPDYYTRLAAMEAAAREEQAR